MKTYCLYLRQWDAAKSKWNKIPCDIHGMKIDPHDPTNRYTKEECEPHATWDEARPSAPYGLAWVMTGDGWFFLDLDDCLGSDGWSAEAQLIWRTFNGALGEVSTSGNGLHIFGRCDPEQLKDRRNKWDGWLEFYTDKRFVALSKDGPRPIGDAYTDNDWTHVLLNWVPEREYLGELPDSVDPAYTGPEDDDKLIEMMLASKGNAANQFGEGVTIRDLWEANAEKLSKKFPAYDGKGGFDHSSADAALMSHLAFWTGKDMPRMDRLFRRSALMREKYEKRKDYQKDTIQNAARLCKGVYDYKKPEPSQEIPETAKMVGGETQEARMFIQEMIPYFEGCVYIVDQHKVLVPDGRVLKPEQFNVVYGGHKFQMMPDLSGATRKAFEAFTENAMYRFPKCNTSCFRPDEPFGAIIDGEVNTYVSDEGASLPGDVEPFMDFLRRLLPNANDRAIVLSWCCGLAQNIGKKPLWALVLQGTEGNGKSMIGEIMAYVIGRKHTHRPRSKEIGSPFNGWMEEALLQIVNEVHMDGRRQALDDLKPFITDMMVPIRRMQQAEVTRRVPSAWYLTTNHKDAIIKSNTDRRYSVFFTAQQCRADVARDFPGDYFPKLWDWLRGGGFAFLAHYLRTTAPDPRYDPFNGCIHAPRTSSTDEAMAASAGGIEAEVLDAVESERQGFRGGWVSTYYLDELLKERGMRISKPRIGSMLENLGYSRWGRSPRMISEENNTRPVLWTTGSTNDPFDVYLKSQGHNYG